MSAKRIEILLLLGFAFSACHVVAARTCWSYMDDGEFECGGAGGCEGYYFRVYCILGCVSGTCNPDGGSGECCGQIFYYAVGYEWGGLDCHGLNCGESPARRARRQEGRRKVNTATLNGKSGLGPLAYQVPRILFVPNRCTHEYEVLFEDFAAPSKGGM